MSDRNIDRAKGKLEQVGGTLERAVGKVIGNDELVSRGAAHEAHGEATQAVAKLGERAKAAGEQLVGTIQAAVGDAVGNDRLAAEGEASKLRGKARSHLNQ